MKAEWEPDELIETWTLTGDDWDLVGNKSGTTRLGFTVMLKFYEIEGRLRHAHATELINSGVSIEVVRHRLGHASTETTQAYAELADKMADTEIRAARRKRETRHW